MGLEPPQGGIWIGTVVDHMGTKNNLIAVVEGGNGTVKNVGLGNACLSLGKPVVRQIQKIKHPIVLGLT